jgi:TP901 family phage tail tape measure protein
MANEIARLFVTIGANTKELDSALGKLETKMNTVGKKMMKVGAGILVGLGAVAGPSIKLAADFDKAMREVNTMMQLAEDEFQAFSDEVQQLAHDMGVDATGAAEALYQAISAGVPKENAIDFLRVATKSAIGGVTDTMTAVDGLTSILNAFKIPVKDAEKVADVMFATVKSGKTTFEELSASIFNVAPVAAAANIRFEEVAAALATMTKQGIPTTVATTELRQAIVMLQKPTDEMAETINALGYESGQTMIEELGLKDSLDLLRDASQGSNERLLEMFGSVEAGQAVLALTGENAQTFAGDLDTIASSAGIAEEAFTQMEESTSRKMEKLMSSVKDVAISIGESLIPALESIMESLRPIIEGIGNWIAQHPELIKVMALAAAAILGTGGIIWALSKLIAVIRSVATGLAILQGLSGPAGWATLAASAGIIAGAVYGINQLLGGEGEEYAPGTDIFGMPITKPELTKEEKQKLYQQRSDFLHNIYQQLIDQGYTADEANRKLAEMTKNLPPLPALQLGGIATRPTLAMIGEAGPEAVVPLRGPGSIGNTFNISQLIVREEADVYKIARELYRMQQVRV